MPQPITFLLVEDDPNEVLLAQRAFRDVPAQVQLQHVGDGREAVRYLDGEGTYADRHQHPLPQVILLDLNMPGFSGFEFLKWLRLESPEPQRTMPVVVMTSSAQNSDVQRAYAAGANAYVTKPFDFGKFKERLKLLGIFWAEHAELPTPNTLH